ncbi:LADA_0F03620g1_1 [Lachancea dasiensis]|uniref:LADA_0F03620g1_1 n=1 Tax=Lachancea dasiensis TaxID=1072105 RepID=A0A1G4JIS5_9SACH|nr:LADA_0F03620g1_1 [Lachancea dasiensis]
MANSHVIVQLGSQVVLAGTCGEYEPLLRYVRSPGEVFDKDTMLRLFRTWLQDPLMVNNSETDVLVIENLLIPMEKKRWFYQMFRQDIGVRSVTFIPDVLTSLVAGGVRDGLVIDIGWEHSIVAPIYDFRILDYHLQVSVKGGANLTNEIKRVCSADTDIIELLNSLWNHNSHDENTEKVRMLIDHEFIGQRDATKFDLDDFPIVSMVWKVFENLALDVRKKLRSNVVITGLPSECVGLRVRLREALSPDFDIVHTLGPWAGGSLYWEQMLESLPFNESMDNQEPNDWHLQRFRVHK